MSFGGRALALAFACALLALWAAGCSDERDSGCGAVCQRTVSFVYETPVAGQSFEIGFSPQGATFSCQVSESGEATCEPSVGGYHLDFGPDGLSSMSWSFAPVGELSVDVTVDGMIVTSQTFEYQPGTADACSGTCPEDPRFQLEHQ
jgi:hypothetical protein